MHLLTPYFMNQVLWYCLLLLIMHLHSVVPQMPCSSICFTDINIGERRPRTYYPPLVEPSEFPVRAQRAVLNDITMLQPGRLPSWFKPEIILAGISVKHVLATHANFEARLVASDTLSDSLVLDKCIMWLLSPIPDFWRSMPGTDDSTLRNRLLLLVAFSRLWQPRAMEFPIGQWNETHNAHGQ